MTDPLVRLFVSDIDGCLAEPYVAWNLEHLECIADWTGKGDPARVPDTLPGLTLCTGRPLGYAEAMAQAIGVSLPFLFEAGAGMYFPKTGVRTWHPSFTGDMTRAVADIQRWLETQTPGTTLSVDRGKHTQAGVIGANNREILDTNEATKRYVQDHHPGFVVAHTDISVDVMSAQLTKAQGLVWLGECLSVSLDEMAFIGDTEGDLAALQCVGHSFAPDNGTSEVRQAVGTVTTGKVSAGVLEAFRACLAHNSP